MIAVLAKLFGWAVKPPGVYLTAALAEQQAVFGDRTQPEDDLLAELDNGRDTAPLHREHA